MENLFKRSNSSAVGLSRLMSSRRSPEPSVLSRVMSTRRSPEPGVPSQIQPADFSQLLESGGETKKKPSLKVATNRLLFGKRLKELVSRNGIPELEA